MNTELVVEDIYFVEVLLRIFNFSKYCYWGYVIYLSVVIELHVM